MRNLVVIFLLGCPPSGTQNPPTIVSFSAGTDIICQPGEVTLSWTVADAEHVFLGDLDVTAKSSVTLQVAATTTYTLSASNAQGTERRTATVTLHAFPGAITEVADYEQPSQGMQLSDDRMRLFLEHAGASDWPHLKAYVCEGSSCADHTMVTSAYSLPSILQSATTSLDGQFFKLLNATAAGTETLWLFAEQADGSFAAGQTVEGLGKNSVALQMASDPHAGKLGASILDPVTGTLGFAEGSPTGMRGGTVLIDGHAIDHAVPLGFGYASNGDPWMLYSTAADTLVFVRRVSGEWKTLAYTTLNGGVALQWLRQGVSVTLSPSRNRALILYTTSVGNNAAGWGLILDLEHNTLGAKSPLMPLTPLAAALSSSAAFSADGSRADYVFGAMNGKLWRGQLVNNTLMPPTAAPGFSGGVQLFRNVCDQTQLMNVVLESGRYVYHVDTL